MDHVMETNSEILNDTKHNQTSLEEVFLRFGLQVKTAQKLAADAFQKLCRNRHDTISFDEFVSIIHCNEDSSVSTYRLHSSDKTNFGNLRSQCDIVDDISAINITDLHAQSGSFLCSFICTICLFLLFCSLLYCFFFFYRCCSLITRYAIRLALINIFFPIISFLTSIVSNCNRIDHYN